MYVRDPLTNYLARNVQHPHMYSHTQHTGGVVIVIIVNTSLAVVLVHSQTGLYQFSAVRWPTKGQQLSQPTQTTYINLYKIYF